MDRLASSGGAVTRRCPHLTRSVLAPPEKVKHTRLSAVVSCHFYAIPNCPPAATAGRVGTTALSAVCYNWGTCSHGGCSWAESGDFGLRLLRRMNI